MTFVYVVLEVLVEEEEQRTLRGAFDQTRPNAFVEAREALVSVCLNTNIPVVIVFLIPSFRHVLVLLNPGAHSDQRVSDCSADHLGHSAIQKGEIVHSVFLNSNEPLDRFITIELDDGADTKNH